MRARSIRQGFLEEVGLELGLRTPIDGLLHNWAEGFEDFGWKKDEESLEKGRIDERKADRQGTKLRALGLLVAAPLRQRSARDSEGKGGCRLQREPPG